MYTVYYFTTINDSDKHYGDCGTRKTEQEHRPQIGDLVPDYLFSEHMSDIRRSDADAFKKERIHNSYLLSRDGYFDFSLYEVERVLYVGNSSFYAYCHIVGYIRDDSNCVLGDYLGRRGDLKSLGYHCFDQEVTFRRGSFIASPAE